MYYHYICLYITGAVAEVYKNGLPNAASLATDAFSLVYGGFGLI